MKLFFDEVNTGMREIHMVVSAANRLNKNSCLEAF
jgi:hypothetical protein